MRISHKIENLKVLAGDIKWPNLLQVWLKKTIERINYTPNFVCKLGPVEFVLARVYLIFALLNVSN